MTTKNRKQALSLQPYKAVILPVLFSFLMFPSQVFAAEWSGKCVSNEGSVGDVATIQGVECIVRNLLNAGVSAVGFASFGMLLVGSFLMLLSGGVPKNVDAGKKTITFAVVGIVVSLTGWILLNFVSVFTGVEQILKFSTQWN
jgi:hypothetical protein